MQIAISSNLNAIYEKEEEEITETIKNTSARQIKNNGSLPQNLDHHSLIMKNNLNPLPVIKSINFSIQTKDSLIHNTVQQSIDSSSLIQIRSSSKPISINQHMSYNEAIDQSKDCLISNHSNFIIYPETDRYYNNNSNFITYKEVFNYYSSLYILFKVSKPNTVQRIHTDSNLCCFKKLLYQYIGRYHLDNELKSDKELLLYISDIAYDSKCEIHSKMFNTICKSIILPNKALIEINEEKEQERYFDSKSALFPIDKGGIYSMIQMLFIIEKYPTFLKEIIDLFKSKSCEQNNIIDILSSITVLCLKYINENELNVYFNQKRNILEALCEFYIGYICQMRIYLVKDTSTIENAFEKTKMDSVATPSSIFWKYEQFKEVYKDESDSLLLTKSCAGF